MAKVCYYELDSFNSLLHDAHKRLTLFHVNVRSIRNKKDQLDDYFSQLSFAFDVLMFSETWLTSGEDPPYFQGYTYNGLVCTEGRGGGVAIYVKDTINHENIPQFSSVNENIECLMMRLPRALTTVVYVIYRPPTASKPAFLESIENVLNYSCHSGLDFAIMGDVNVDMLSLNASARQLTEVMNYFACENVITKATRVTAETATLLDICITNLCSLSCVAGTLSLGISDHLPIFLAFPISRDRYQANNNEKVVFRKINDHTLEVFRQRIIEEDWERVLQVAGPNDAYEIFFGKLEPCYDIAFP